MEPVRDVRALNTSTPDPPTRPDDRDPPAKPSRGSRPTYKGEPLEAARGPGLGCFWFQVALLAIFVVITPMGALNGWPLELSTALLIITIVLLFFTGQTLIFLLRLVAADRRCRRRPMASATKTVGELEDEAGE